MDNQIMMFVLQGALAIIMLFFGFILNGLRTSIERVAKELKTLNDAVLGEYITRIESDEKWREQRLLDREQNVKIQQALVGLAALTGKPQ